MKILITGTAGFIGFHLLKKLVSSEHEIIGLDVINDYYDINLKYSRLKETGINENDIQYNNPIRSTIHKNYSFIKLDLGDKENIDELFRREKFDVVCNLAAQAGVRYSITNPYVYLHSNIEGFLNILEGCRHNNVGHLAYASSSSVYGMNKEMPFSEHHNVDHPLSLYAASKKSNELMAHTYSHLYNLPTTGLRFFTVYGPWGRPDMALFIFTKAILEGKAIDVFNEGQMARDFTYIDDIVEGIYRIMFKTPEGNDSWDGMKPDPASSSAPYRIYNIGKNNPVQLLDFIKAIEKYTGKKAELNMLPMQAGDVVKTWANTNTLMQDTGYMPSTSIDTGIERFVKWYKEYYGV